MALLTFGHQGRRDPERSGKTHLDGRQVVSTSFAKVFLNTLILGQNWSLGGGVWPTSSKWLRRRRGPWQVQKSVEGVENTILTPGFQSGYISGGLWSSAWKAREPKDSKNLQGFKFETKQKCLTDIFFLISGWVLQSSKDCGWWWREIWKSHEIQDCCGTNLARLLLMCNLILLKKFYSSYI